VSGSFGLKNNVVPPHATGAVQWPAGPAGFAAANLLAAGSLPRSRALANPSSGRRVRLLAELALLFVGVPLALTYAIKLDDLSFALLLLPVGVALYLAQDRTFAFGRELNRGASRRDISIILALFVVIGSVVAVWIWLARPADFLSLPRSDLWAWIAVMLLYPPLSAWPQELVFRTFFFHRYGMLFRGNRLAAIAVNGALFGFAHIVFESSTSIVLSGALGVVLAYRYCHTRSLWTAWFEHVLYGLLVFTIGLGGYFGASME
jgi:membrane protease YdiL (CAAX protease family)